MEIHKNQRFRARLGFALRGLAHALRSEQMTLLNETLRAALGKTVSISARVDANLLGGLVVKVGSKMIDSSLRTKLNNLKVAMKGTL